MKTRFIDIDIYNEGWFRNLSGKAKYFYGYLFNRVDNAGFLDLIPKQIELDTGISEEVLSEVLNEMDDLLIWSMDKNTLFLKEFLPTQKNLPLNRWNKAHKQIIEVFARRLLMFKDRLEYFNSILCHHRKKDKNSKEIIEDKRESILETVKWLVPVYSDQYKNIN